MTEYEARQTQRGIERQIRKYKREIAGFDAAGIDSTQSRTGLLKWQERQRDFIEQTGLKRDYNREVVEGYSSKSKKSGKSADKSKKIVANGVIDKNNKKEFLESIKKAKVDKSSNGDIIKEDIVPRKLSLSNIEDFEKWQNDYYAFNKSASFERKDNQNIYEYTCGSYDAINAVLRGGESLEKVKRCYGSSFDIEEYKNIADGISRELSKFKLNEPLELRRSVGNVDYITGATSSVEDMKKAIGKTYTEKGFTSTTVCADAMLPFGGCNNPTKTTLEIIAPVHTKGAYVYKISDSPAEFEFLIDKDTVFEIVDAGERVIDVKDFKGNITKKTERYMRLKVVVK